MSIDYIFEGSPPPSVPPKTALGVDASTATLYIAQPQNGTWAAAISGGITNSGGTVASVPGTIYMASTSFGAFVGVSDGIDGYAPYVNLADSAGNNFTLGGGTVQGTNWILANAAGSADISNPFGTDIIRLGGATLLAQSAPSPSVVPPGQLGIGAGVSPTATAGSGTLPATPAGFLEFTLNSGVIKIPYYNA